MSDWFCAITRAAAAFVRVQTVRQRVLHRDRLERDGGAIYAVTHLGNLEPVFVALLTRRPIWWMARTEFYRHPLARWCLDRLRTFPVHRQGVPVGAIRRAVRLVREGRAVGIFPEGGVAKGRRSMLLGGPAKGGACLVALRSARPIVPIAVVGTPELNAVAPWLPFRRARVWINIGEPIHPEPFEPLMTRASRRAARRALAERLAAAYPALYRELLDKTDLRPLTAVDAPSPDIPDWSPVGARA